MLIMEFFTEEIKKRRKDIENNILKSFNNDIEKALPIGEIREFADGTYKKVDNGKWVKITNGKEKGVSNSSISKKIKEEIQNKQKAWEEAKKEFENSFQNKFSKGSGAYKIFFEKAWADEIQQNKFLKRIKDEQKVLNDEIKEIQLAIAAEKKTSRETSSNKKEIGVDDLKNFLKDSRQLFHKVDIEIPKFARADEVLPQVTVDDYFLDTETTYESLLSEKDDWKEVENRWIEMKKSGKYQWHQSPKSSSEYLINEQNGDIYRFSDHWGRVASCTWDITSEITSGWDIAKSNIKNFKRKKSGLYFNPQYRIKKVEAAEMLLPKLKTLVSENKDFYLSKQANKLVSNFVEDIFSDLKTSALLSVEEINKIKEKYNYI